MTYELQTGLEIQKDSSDTMLLSNVDRDVLRKLAGQVAELAARTSEQDKRNLWYTHNALGKTRPLVFCDPENGWNEIITQDMLMCNGHLARGWEMTLRREIFWGQEIQDDRVIQPYFDVLYPYSESDWGMHEKKIGGNHGGAYTWEPPLKSYDDLDKLRFPKIGVDCAAHERLLEAANDVFRDLLTVRTRSFWWWSLGMTYMLIRLRGLEQIMYDMIDCPEGLHALMAFLRDGHLAKLQFLQDKRLLTANHDGEYVGSGGFGWTRELPGQDFNGVIRLCDMWGFSESQETVGVSPEMFEEFIFPYQLPISGEVRSELLWLL